MKVLALFVVGVLLFSLFGVSMVNRIQNYCDADVTNIESTLPANALHVPAVYAFPISTTDHTGYKTGKEADADVVDESFNLVSSWNSYFDNFVNCTVYNPMSIIHDVTSVPEGLDILCDSYDYFTDGSASGSAFTSSYKEFYQFTTYCSRCNRYSTFTVNVKDCGAYNDYTSYKNLIEDTICPYCNITHLVVRNSTPKYAATLASALQTTNDLLQFLDDFVGIKETFQQFPWPSSPEWTIPCYGGGITPDPIVFVVNMAVGVNELQVKQPYNYTWNPSLGQQDNLTINFIDWDEVWDLGWCVGFHKTDPTPPDYFIYDKFHYWIFHRLKTSANIPVAGQFFLQTPPLPDLPGYYLHHSFSFVHNIPSPAYYQGYYWYLSGVIDRSDGIAHYTNQPFVDIWYMDTWHEIDAHYMWVGQPEPEVVNTSPPDGQTNVNGTPIIVFFSNLMNETATQNAFSVNPSLSGTFHWAGPMILIFWPSIIGLGTTYTVTILGGWFYNVAKDMAGHTLEKPYRFSFTTSQIPTQRFPDLGISVYPGIPTPPGDNSNTTITVWSISNFSSPVYLSLSGLPEGAEYRFSPNPVKPPPNESAESNLTIWVPQTTEIGPYNLTIRGTAGPAGEYTRYANSTLIVTPSPLPPTLPPQTFQVVYVSPTKITILGDINGDGVVDIFDVVKAALAFDSRPGDPNWNQAADLNNDDVVDIFDIVLLANNFGKTA